MSKERIVRDVPNAENNIEPEPSDVVEIEDVPNSGYGGVIGLEADEDIFYYRWGKYNVGLIGKVHVVKEIMEVLSNAQKQS